MQSDRVGRYQIKSEIGRGGMATVYLAHDPQFQRDVAVKILPREFLHDPQFRGRFEREAKTIASLEHAAIVPVYDFGEQDGLPYLVMRYMPGGSLDDRLQQGTLTLDEALDVLKRIGPALEKAHQQGIVHRDLKPANILIDQDNLPYLADFGLVKLREASVAYTGSAVLGTPTHMSPEQAKGEKGIDGRSDIYALGAILFQAISGAPPYDADTAMGIALKHITEPVPSIRNIDPDFPAELDHLIQRAMAKDPQDRFQTVGDLVRGLEIVIQRSSPSLSEKEQKPPPITASPDPEEEQDEPVAQELETTLDLGSPAEYHEEAAPAVLPQKTTALDVPEVERSVTGGVRNNFRRVLFTALAVLIPAAIIVVVVTSNKEADVPSHAPFPSHTPAYTQAPISAPTSTLRPADLAATLLADPTKITDAPQSLPTPWTGADSGQNLDPAQITEFARYTAETTSFRKVVWSPDGQRLAADESVGAYTNRVINVWDSEHLGSVALRLDANTFFIEGLSWSPDGRTLASGNQNGTVQIWDTETGAEIVQLDASAGSVVNISWSPDMTLLATASSDDRIKLWNPRTGGLVREMCCHTFRKFVAGALAWSTDGALLASVASDSTVRLWEVSTGIMQRAVCCTDSDWSRAVAWSPDGSRLAAAGYSGLGAGSVTIWGVDTWAQDLTLSGNSMSIMDFDWSPDGRMIVAGGNDGNVYIWETATGNLLKKITISKVHPQTNWIYAVDWSPDGRYIAIGSDEGTLRIYANP